LFDVRILGELKAAGGRSPVALGPPLQRALFALLVLRANEIVSVDRLIEDLWEPDAPRTAAKSVQTYVSRLRDELERSGADARIETRAPGYVLRVDPEVVDAVRFERLAGEAATALADARVDVASTISAEALALWHGQPLSEFAYRDFAQRAIARLEESYEGLLETRFDARLAQGQHEQLVKELEAAVQTYPLRERLREQLMLAFYRSGRQAEALDAYRAVRQTLVDELGIDPGPDLQALERAILTQDPSLDLPIVATGVALQADDATAEPRQPEEPLEPPIGRDAEHETVVGFLGRLPAGCHGLLLEGEAGIGKTTVWEVGVAEARRRGYEVLSIRVGASESQLSYAGLGDLLDPVFGRVVAKLPMPQRRGLEAALALTEAEMAPDLRVLGLALLNVIRCLSADGPLVIAIDDLQWLDAPSSELVAFAMRRLREEPVGLLASVRTGVRGAGLDVLERAFDGRVTSLEVGALSLGAVQRLLRGRLSQPPTRSLLRRVYDRSGGNPFYALELARVIDERGEERMPDSLRGLVADRLEQMPAETQSLILVLASAMLPSLEMVRALSAEDALDSAERAKVVVIDGPRVRFSHPLLAAAARESATTRERRAAHRRLAEIVDDPEQRARHLALATEGPDKGVATALDAAVVAALARAAPGPAADLSELALDLTPPDDHAMLQRRRVEAAMRNQTVGNTRRQRELLELALAEAATALERASALRQLATLVAEDGDIAAARGLTDEALRCAAGDDALCASILLETSGWDTGYSATLERAEAALEHAERSGDPALEAGALASLAQSTFAHGLGFRRDLFDRAVELEGTAGYIEATALPTTTYGWTAKWAGDIPLGRELLERSAARLHDHEDATAAGAMFYLAWLHFIAGEWARALERADESRQVALDAALDWDAAVCLVTRATVEAHQGRLDDAAAHLDETRALAEAFEPLWEFGDAMVALSAGNPARAAETLGPAMARMIGRGMEEPGLHPWFPTLVEALVQIGRVGDAEELVAWMEERALRLERRWALAMCAHARGSVAAARGDVEAAMEAFERAVELHEGVGRPFDRAWTLLAYGQALRRAKRRRAAREVLAEALAEFERLGAALWADKASAELARIGGRASATSGLTPTEERIAALVVAGKSNKEVASELYLTVRTVETNLSRIYAKLGIRSRTELAARQKSK
jgi:DNA-binding SARP family transcriptional activator/DNA-binding CsgD family transcriptional regulator